MAGPWLISYIVLWILVLALGLLYLAHSRLLGLLHQRVGPGITRPFGAGPAVGDKIGDIEGTTLLGQRWTRSFPADLETLVVMVSPQCSACNELMPHVKDFLAIYGAEVEVYLLSVLRDPAMNRAYADFAGLPNTPFVIADRFAERLKLETTPYGLKLDRNGVVLARGVVNHFEHLISMWKVTAVAADSTELPQEIGQL